MSLDYFLKHYRRPIKSGEMGQTALLCNQTSYSFSDKKYLFEILHDGGFLSRIFIPEHGLFAELQDQEPLSKTQIYSKMTNTEIMSLYQKEAEQLYIPPEILGDIDTLIIDIQDVGSRYYTFATTLSYVMEVLSRHDIDIRLIVIERPNPAGRQVEGTPLAAKYESFVGRVGLPHRHGLTIGELSRFYQKQFPGNYQLEIIYDPEQNYLPEKEDSWYSLWKCVEITPSPNMASPIIPLVYSGQCLLEATNLSEGRGTTRPFEIWGAPYMQGALQRKDFPSQKGAFLRPLFFRPVFHKFADELCFGFQIHLEEKLSYHSLSHTLRILRWMRENFPDDFAWKKGVYEFCSNLPAIEILTGDDLLINYLYNDVHFSEIIAEFCSSEREWISNTWEHLIHPSPLKRIDLNTGESIKNP